MKPRVLMLGWEFPPYKSGGLGTACYDLTKGLAQLGTRVTFVMPFAPDNSHADFVKLVGTEALLKNVKMRAVNSSLRAYQTSETYSATYNDGKKGIYGKNLYEEVQRYASVASRIARTEKHDIIHAHDWMTYPAAIEARKTSGKPLVVHLHATEFDRTAGNPDPRISHIEYTGLRAADAIITNSHFSKTNILKHYKLPADNIEVVHWGIDDAQIPPIEARAIPEHKTVLFLGRVTIQKGPDYFIEAAKIVAAHESNVKFVIVGDGDMLPLLIHRSAELGLSDKVIFTGALRGADVHKAFQTADVYVMPSVSEPFGLVALESIKNGTPVILSNQSGVSEVVSHALKVDFWNVHALAEKITAVLRHPPLRSELAKNGLREAKKFTLDIPARKVLDVYARNILKD